MSRHWLELRPGCAQLHMCFDDEHRFMIPFSIENIDKDFVWNGDLSADWWDCLRLCIEDAIRMCEKRNAAQQAPTLAD